MTVLELKNKLETLPDDINIDVLIDSGWYSLVLPIDRIIINLTMPNRTFGKPKNIYIKILDKHNML